MDRTLIISGRRSQRRASRRKRPLAEVLARPGALAAPYPGYLEQEDEAKTRRFVTGSLLVHLAGFAVLLAVASLAPVIEEQIIPVQLLRETPPPPPPPEEPAAAPKALAQRRNLPFAPAVQAVQPQIVNPRIIAKASPAVAAEALQMDAVASSSGPTDLHHQSVVVERVSAVSTAVRARAAAVDVSAAAGPVVRGPTRVAAPVGPSVGPRRVEAAAVGDTMGTAPLQIGSGNGSSVRDGVLSDRDVIGSPDGALVVSVDTTIGDGPLGGTAPTGAGGTTDITKTSCMGRSEVKSYLVDVRNRTLDRWILPPGVDAGSKVTLRFHLDVAGSASKVAIVAAEDNALGASAVDALRSAAPFPPMPEQVRCLARVPIVGTFSNPVGG